MEQVIFKIIITQILIALCIYLLLWPETILSRRIEHLYGELTYQKVKLNSNIYQLILVIISFIFLMWSTPMNV